MSEPTEEEVQKYMAETGFGYHVAKAMLQKAAVDGDDAGDE